MARKGRHRRSGRPAPKSARPRVTGPQWPDERPSEEVPELIRSVRRAVRGGDPLELLALTSSLMTLVDPREQRPFPRAEPPPPGEPRSPGDLAEMFIDVDTPETPALLAAFAGLTADDLLRARLGRVLADRRGSLPRWLSHLDAARAHRTLEMVHILGDGDNVMIGLQLADGQELTVVVYIDHNMGTLVKDAFVLSTALDEVIDLMRAHAERGTEWRDLDAADARTRITDAIERGAMSFPPFESETWPACRPLVEWAVRMLPEGGQGYERPDWSDGERQALADRFFASPFGRPLDDEDHRDLLESILWFACDYGPGDPLRWSPVAVEIVLLDWFPRKILADATYLAMMPAVLSAFIRFCHDERGILADLTAETIEALDRHEPEYQQIIRSPRPQGVQAIVEALGDLGAFGDRDREDAYDPHLDDEPWDHTTSMLSILRDAVGGDETLQGLDTAPLPDEAFEWAGIADDIRPRVQEVLDLCDRCCDELFDVEYRTACRRLLAQIAAGDARVFRRPARSETAASAICWIVGKGNHAFQGGALYVKDLAAYFGLAQGVVSQRATTLLGAAGLAPSGYGELSLGNPRLLVAARRTAIVDLRDRYQG